MPAGPDRISPTGGRRVPVQVLSRRPSVFTCWIVDVATTSELGVVIEPGLVVAEPAVIVQGLQASSGSRSGAAKAGDELPPAVQRGQLPHAAVRIARARPGGLVTSAVTSACRLRRTGRRSHRDDLRQRRVLFRGLRGLAWLCGIAGLGWSASGRG